MYRVSVIFGTRPEAIKLAPIIHGLQRDSRFECRVWISGQHHDLLFPILKIFDIVPDRHVELMRPHQTLATLSARTIETVDGFLVEETPDMVLIQGDTTTVFGAALAAFYRRVPSGHIEAGLRTGNLDAPWPEEANRQLVSRLAALHFAPTATARDHLLAEGISPTRIFVTGNSIVDALNLARRRSSVEPPTIAGLDPRYFTDPAAQIVLITSHRRENFGPSLENICAAIRELARRFPDTAFVYPAHPNPQVREPINRLLKSETGTIRVIEALPYLDFIALMSRATLILTDSGGIQEEAPSFGVPVLILRESTERPEAIEANVARLVGTDPVRIIHEAARLLADPLARQKMTSSTNPFGDGYATTRILDACAEFLANSR